MPQLWTIIAVADVRASLAWYETLLGLPRSEPAHDHFAQVRDPDGTVLLALHAWGAHEHPTLTSATFAVPGNGLLLFFRVADWAAALATATQLVGTFAEAPHRNPNTGTLELSVRDPDGYYVTLSALTPPTA